MRKENIKSSFAMEAATAISVAHLLHPATPFNHPSDVLHNEHISKGEKRAILASWASDIFSVESIPALRLYPGTNKAVSYDDIIDALKILDKDGEASGERVCARSAVPRRHCRNPRTRRFGGLGLCSYWKGERRRQPFEI
ncbi:hypothetical protein FHX06_007231 [Rhizobium sp. BK512]|jgi:hypothetical protein|uniref:hypothetical protein n=1 Tax=Rhizobium sp. BK512 TaxID=2587010 RepID=UPI0003A6B74C|nr:hypothetical protein [Rhizobium sp. BK512]MBB3565857.1 hypothetical protein [Rhizobium sp. BK512]